MTTAITADAFLDTLGVDTHIGISGPYSDLSLVEQDLSYLGVPIVRDSIDSAGAISEWQQVAQATGVKFDDFMPEGATAWDQSALALVPQLVQDGLLAYVEGGNEEDDSYAAANGNSLSWTAQFQQQVFAMGQQEGIPVINMSFGQGWTAANNWEGDYPDVGNLSAYTDYANAHTYPNPGETSSAAMNLINADAKLAASSRPVITTEMGWQTSQFSATQIAQDAVDATFDGILDGNAGTWFYGLYDDSSGTWGLFNSDGSARQVATAIHDVTTLLADNGSDAKTFTPGSLNYSLSGTVSGDNSFLMEKSDGSFWIGLWDESAGQHTVTVNLPSNASEIEVYDPITGTTAIESASNANSISVSLGSDPLLIEIVPTGGGATTGTTTSSSGSTTTSSGSTGSTGTTGSDPSNTAGGASGTPTDLTVSVPGGESVAAGKAVSVTGASVTDAWAAGTGGLMALNVWDQSGTLTINGQTYGPGGGPVADGMLSGSLAQINADLASMTYTASGTASSDTITVDVWNQAGVEVKETIPVTITSSAGSGGTTSGGGTTSTSGSTGTTSSTGTSGTGSTSSGTSSSTSGSTSTTGTELSNTAGGASGTPTDLTVSVPSGESVATGKTVSVTGASVTDAWAAGTGGMMALNVWDQSGTLTIDGHTYGPGGGPVADGMLSGSLAQINADLASLTYTASGTASSDTITVDVWNQAGVEAKDTIPVSITSSASSGSTTSGGGTTSTTTTTGTIGSSGTTGNQATTGNTITIASTDADPVETVSNTTITATTGNHMVFISGTGDVVTLTGGTETVQAYQGGNTITTGTGNDLIKLAGSGNVVNAGGGTNTIDDSGSNNTIVLPTAGGTDDVYGWVAQNGDTFDLRTALASTSWNGTEGTLGNYISVSTQNTNALITLHPTGGTAGSVIATLEDAAPMTLSSFLQHAIT